MITTILLGALLGVALAACGRLLFRNQILADERDQLATACNRITLRNIHLLAERERAVDRHREFLTAHVGLIVDNCAQAAELDAAYARIAELADNNQLLRDDVAECPIPFTIVGGDNAVPTQRAAGDQS